MFYIIVIIVSAVTIVGAHLLISPFSVELLGRTVLGVTVGGLGVFAIDAILALVIRRLLPESWFAADKKAFEVSKRECSFYRTVGVKFWIDKVPELGMFTGFSKSKLKSVSEKDYLARFLLEANYGVVIHLANGLFGFLIAFIPFCSKASIWIPVFAVNLFLSILPVMILRYNTYTLARLHKRSLKRQQENK